MLSSFARAGCANSHSWNRFSLNAASAVNGQATEETAFVMEASAVLLIGLKSILKKSMRANDLIIKPA